MNLGIHMSRKAKPMGFWEAWKILRGKDVYIHIHILYVCIYINTYTYAYTYAYTYTYTYTYNTNILYVCIYINTYTYACCLLLIPKSWSEFLLLSRLCPLDFHSVQKHMFIGSKSIHKDGWYVY